MHLFSLPEEYVKKISFIADAFERDNGFRPSDFDFICAAITCMFDGVAESIGHGICEGDDD